MKKWHILKLLLLCIPLQILANTYIINPEHSKIKFSISYMKFTEVEGVFPLFNIFFEMDDSLSLSNIEGKIEVSSINTNDKKRDSHLKRADFFDAEKFSHIGVNLNPKSKGLRLDKAKSILIDMTIKDITKTINFDIEYLGERPDPWTKVLGHYFNLKGEINRLDFGVSWNKALENEEGFLLGEKVKINATLESYKSNEKPAFSRFYKEKTTHSPDRNTLDLQEEKSLPEPSFVNNEAVKTKTTIQNESEYSSFKNVAITLISGFVIFLALIVLGIYSQKKLLEYLETKNFGDTVNYIISSGVIMIILIIVSIFVAPYMGHGINPLTKLFN